MSFLQDDVLNAILDNLWSDTAYGLTPPGTWYLALFTTLPATDGTGGVEASYTDYARAAVANDATEWPASAAGVKSNANPIAFGVAGSGPTSVVGVGFYDDPTATGASPLWAVVDLTGAPVVINNGADVSILAGALDLTGCA